MRLDDFMRAQALRAAIELQPIDGPGGRLFPPTYPPVAGSRDKAARHVVETLPSGEIRVLVDSVASQANRQEEALVAARAAGLREQGITAERVILRWAMPLAAIRRLRFGGGERDAAGRAYVTVLGVLARALGHQAGYSLRSRCDLLVSGPLVVDVIDSDGAIETALITVEDAIKLFEQAEEGLRRAGIAVHGKVVAKPSHKLMGLIKANRQAQEIEADPVA